MDVVKSSAPDATLIAHIGSINEGQATELALHAKKLNYDVISSVAPFYYKFSFEEIKKYYFRLADAAGLPMLVYHFPKYSGVNMGIAEMRQFLEDDRFLEIKYTSNDFFTMERCKSTFPEKIVYNGFDEMFLCGLSIGDDGGIGSTYNFMADKFVKMKELFEAGKMAEALEIQKVVNRIIVLLHDAGGTLQAEKEILNRLGFDFGVFRNPFVSPTPEQKEIVAKEIIPLLNV